MFKKRCKSNKNKTNIQFFHELFTGYFIKYFNPLPFHLIIKEKSHPKATLYVCEVSYRLEYTHPAESANQFTKSQGAWHGVTIY